MVHNCQNCNYNFKLLQVYGGGGGGGGHVKYNNK